MINTIIRASSLPSYTDCPRRWAAKALSKEIKSLGFNIAEGMTNSVGASVGTATHSGAAFIMTEKMASGELGNQNEAEQKALEDFDISTKGGVLWDEATADIDPYLVKALRGEAA